ncbi:MULTISPECIES: MgtC/SapB family protein [unclassified Streptomyces]|uniref:MgtC/SapB family protein n=1 Tax=unclassified Streptomyces TaxID=2593676 RepID=UPI0021C61019|nr:MgtC/SapB family protein [Streptomyces sp. FIT100]UUN29922.1 MgtC/SapB family protein [Streptomyces sp. FIT100]
MNAIHFTLGLGTGMLSGALIGIERQWRQRMAGLRTNTLVATGAALFVLLSGSFDDSSPSRVAAQVVSGIGFLGAGVIMRDGLNVTGINTAATLWCSAAVGCLAGAGKPWEALAGAVAIVAVNTALRSATRTIDRRPGSGDEVPVPYCVEAVVSAEHEAHVRTLLIQSLTGPESRLHAVQSAEADAVEGEAGLVRIRAEITAEGTDSTAVESAVARISMEPSVASAAWRQTAPA